MLLQKHTCRIASSEEMGARLAKFEAEIFLVPFCGAGC